jgi:hypothetical protein
VEKEGRVLTTTTTTATTTAGAAAAAAATACVSNLTAPQVAPAIAIGTSSGAEAALQQDSGAVAALPGAQQQQQPNILAIAVDHVKEYHKNVMRKLRSSSSIQQVQAVAEQEGSAMDGRSVMACFTAAASIIQRQQQQHQGWQGKVQQPLSDLLQLLVPLLRQKLQQLDATGVVLVLYSLAVCRHKDDLLVADLVSCSLAMTKDRSSNMPHATCTTDADVHVQQMLAGLLSCLARDDVTISQLLSQLRWMHTQSCQSTLLLKQWMSGRAGVAWPGCAVS